MIFFPYYILCIYFGLVYRWKRTLNLARSLCKLQFEEFTERTTQKGLTRKRTSNNLLDKVNKRPQACKDEALPLLANFPTSKELAIVSEKDLMNRCKLGYRARDIIDLAKRVESGKLNLRKIEEALEEASCKMAYEKFMKVKGLGPFVCTNILMCMGFYQKVPIDTETIRHLQTVCLFALHFALKL